MAGVLHIEKYWRSVVVAGFMRNFVHSNRRHRQANTTCILARNLAQYSKPSRDDFGNELQGASQARNPFAGTTTHVRSQKYKPMPKWLNRRDRAHDSNAESPLIHLEHRDNRMGENSTAATPTAVKQKSIQKSLSEFRYYLFKGDVSNALLYKDYLVAEGKISAKETEQLMTLLLEERQLSLAKQCFEYLAEKNRIPGLKLFEKFMNQLNCAGDHEYMKRVGSRLESINKPGMQDAITTFRQCLAKGDVTSALGYKHDLMLNGQLTNRDVSRFIELLLLGDLLTEAKECYEYLANKHQLPRPEVLSFLVKKLAQAGDVVFLERIGYLLSDEQKREVSFNNRLCNAVVAAGGAQQFIWKLSNEIIAAHTPEQVERLAVAFPRGGIFGLLTAHPELLLDYKLLAEEYAAKKALGPMNILWQYYVVKEHEEEAVAVWNTHLAQSTQLMYQHIVNTARTQLNERIIIGLIFQFRSVGMPAADIGSLYSCLIDIQTRNGALDVALATLQSCLEDFSQEHIKHSVLSNLKKELIAKGKEFPYVIPEKEKNKSSSESSENRRDIDKGQADQGQQQKANQQALL